MNASSIIILIAGAYVFGVVLYLGEENSTLVVSALIALAIVLFHEPLFRALGV